MQIISGPGVGLPYPQNLYPSQLANAPADAPTNVIGLAPGEAVLIPSGRWIVTPGSVSVVQFLDPVTGIWRGAEASRGANSTIYGDGFTRRVANLTGCPVTAVVANGGSGFAQASAAITSNLGGSTWQAVVGGSLSVSAISAVGAKYTIAPEVFISAPPAPGVQATAYSTITNGTVTSVSLTNFGAGYTTAPVTVLVPSPFDPNAGAITNGTAVLILNAANAGMITAALCTNNGTPLATLSALTLTAAGGAGTGAVITPVVLQAVVSAVATAGGGGWGNAAAPAAVTTVGGQPASVSAIGNPALEMTTYRPRVAHLAVTTSATGAISAPVVIDSGLFAGTPTAVILSGGAVPTTLASITLTMGAVQDTILMQPT